MTASANSVSNQSSSNASAIQARANLQSAAIGLLGAGISSSGNDGGSFAQSLEAESNRQSGPQGFFSEAAEQSRSTGDRSRPRSLSKGDLSADSRSPDEDTDVTRRSIDTDVPRRTSDSDTSPEDSSPAIARPHENTIRAHTANEPGANIVTNATSPVAEDAPIASPTSEASKSEQGTQSSTEKSARTPTDPLRLITPRQQPEVEDAPLPAQTGAAQTAAETTISQQAATKQSASRSNDNSIKSTGATASTAVAPTSGIVAPSAVAGTSGAGGTPTSGTSLNVSATSGASGSGTQIAAPLDQVSPPKTGNGRMIEQPITLKFKAATANGSSQLSNTEISAAETQLGRSLTTALRQNSPQVTLWMSPETLGKVRIQLTFDQGTISARFEATSEATKDLLAQNMGALRDALQSRGLTAQHIEVVSIPDWSQQSGSQTGSQSQTGSDGRGAGSDLSQQGMNNGNTPSGQGGQPQQGQPEHSREWARMASREAETSTKPGPDAQISLALDSRLLSLKAHLELDAVA